ncbi:hypothetical protein H257_15692 [Aphanomyces astaci]|uniref:Uncharacterized protein n=1 Tax=Aphanomyces astaci TaxID=112090 RepID=W4FN66_APHAT|nr:hypothetical protein H257_15692 [Aphanomyces astaci]ETV68371.1 hypothetical protein H257_15692 [Aphanomyces astaci]|eukprot:XP_009842166.1 hypothetical protein H257_15692 [Aphanomyces astaci]
MADDESRNVISTRQQATTVQDLRDNRLSDGYKKGYRSGLRQIVAWLCAAVQTGSINPDGIINLDVFTYEDFTEFVLHNVVERYVHYDGLVVAGLPLGSGDFAVLPPHFIAGSDDAVTASGQLVFPRMWRHEELRGVLKSCLATLIYHKTFLENALPSEHPLLSSVLFGDPLMATRLPPKVTLASTMMQSTGIPPQTWPLYVTFQEKSELSSRAFLTKRVSHRATSHIHSSSDFSTTPSQGLLAQAVVLLSPLLWTTMLQSARSTFRAEDGTSYQWTSS